MIPKLNGNIPTPTAGRREAAFVVALLAAFLAVNLFTALSYPHVWTDEVMYTDPAANLFMGKGFLSTAWYTQTGDSFFAGNTPLHPLTLAGWFQLFGFSPLAVRSINFVWFTLGTFLVWRFCVRVRWIESTRLRLLLIILLATGSGVSFSYRSGRPDMICYFLVASCLSTATIQKNAFRNLCLLALGILFPWAGLQLLPLLAAATVLIFAFGGIRPALNGVFLGFGAMIGLAGLFWFYASHGVWNDFLASIARHTVGTVAKDYRQDGWIGLFLRDRSAPFLLLLNAWLGIRALKIRDFSTARIVLFGLAAGILIPLGLQLVGVFPIYYGWMTALPQALTICHALSRQPLDSFWTKSAAAILLAGAVCVGLPSRLLVASLRSDDKPYSAVQQFVSTNLRASDEVYADYAAYYPAMLTAKKVFTLRYLDIIPSGERAAITALVIDPEHFSDTTNSIPGNWRLSAELKNQNTSTSRLPAFVTRRFQSQQTAVIYAPYHLAVYRKSPDNVQK
jgi:hypothetical protein